MFAPRPLFHFSPPSGWMNDPNGLVFHAGQYHLFYQYFPHSADWGPMHWGHAVSRDLVRWEHLPVALFPDEDGMIFSGSAVVDWRNTAGFGRESLVACYTRHREPGHHETQCLAYCLDGGRTWHKYENNPVLSNPSLRDFRDPKVFWWQDRWQMALAAGRRVLFYQSPDLKNWTFGGDFSVESDEPNSVWETPDLFPLPLGENGETRWVLTLGVSDGGPAGGSASRYFIGRFDGQTFYSETAPDIPLWLDYGPDCYAAQTWSDEPSGRRVLAAWLSNWRYARQTPPLPARGMLTLPRELSLIETADGPRLVQKPISELATFHETLLDQVNFTLQPGQNLLEGIRGTALDLELEVLPSTPRFGLRLLAGRDECTLLTVDFPSRRICIDRSRSGRIDFHPDFAAAHSAPLPNFGETLRLRIVLDSNSLEVFAVDGQTTITELIFPSPESTGLELFTESGNLRIQNLRIHRLTLLSTL